MKLVSVVVQAYNSADTILRTLNSIKDQTYHNIELIITDDKSKDNTVEVATKWVKDNGDFFKTVKIVTSEKNTGIPKSNNRALKKATGDYVFFLAADDYLAVNAIEEFVGYCERNKGVIPISKVNLFSDDENCDFSSVEKYCENCYKFSKLSSKEQYKRLLVKNMIVAPAAAFYPMELMRKCNGFDEDFWIEDYPINIKILRNGYRFGLIDEPLIYYRISSSSIMGSGNSRVKKAETSLFFKKRFWYLIGAGMIREALGQAKYWMKIDKIKKIPSRIDRKIETIKYKNNKFANKLKILNVDQSLSYIEENKVSFYRYGDGEIAIMMGEGIAFQEADEKLAARLTQLLIPEFGLTGIKAAIPYYYFNYEQGLIDFVESFAYAMKVQRRYLMNHCDKDYVYLDTSISQIYQSYAKYDFDNYFKRVKKLFAGRKVTLICGEGIFKDIKYDLLEECESVTYMYAPSKNAFSEYDSILTKALTIPRENLVCIVLGPTAKPLAYDLYKAGYQAWDIGHFIKDYDAWCNKNARDEESIAKFYRPD